MRATTIGKTADYVGGSAYSSTYNIGQQGTGVSTVALSSGDISLQLGSGTVVSVGAAVAGSGAGQTTASAYAKANAINSAGVAGLTAQADTTVQFDMAATAVGATEDTYSLSLNGVAIYTAYNATTSGAITADQLVNAINGNSASSGVTASYDSTNTRVTLSASDGRNIAIVQNSNVTASAGLKATEGTNNASNTASMATAGGNVATTNTYVGSIRMTAADTITVGGTASRIGFSATAYALGASALNSASVTTVANANTAIGRVDAALSSVSTLRSTLGAMQNRFASAVATINAANENQTAARSRIQDTDFAAETANLTRAQILQQAGTAMLAQANALPNTVLSLLK
jgi:flagellin